MTDTPPPNLPLRKIVFKLVQDSDGYPPVGYESVWAELLPDGTYRIDNFPWYTCEATYNDIVAVKPVGDELFFDKLVVPAGNTLLRVIMFHEDQAAQLKATLKSLGCTTESCTPEFFAVHVPHDVVYAPIHELLARGRESEAWDFEVAILYHDPPASKAALRRTKRRRTS